MRQRAPATPLQRRAIAVWTLVWIVIAVLMWMGILSPRFAGPATLFVVIVGVFTGVVSIAFNLNRGGRWYY
jgi:polyferredoxin